MAAPLSILYSIVYSVHMCTVICTSWDSKSWDPFSARITHYYWVDDVSCNIEILTTLMITNILMICTSIHRLEAQSDLVLVRQCDWQCWCQWCVSDSGPGFTACHPPTLATAWPPPVHSVTWGQHSKNQILFRKPLILLGNNMVFMLESRIIQRTSQKTLQNQSLVKEFWQISCIPFPHHFYCKFLSAVAVLQWVEPGNVVAHNKWSQI